MGQVMVADGVKQQKLVAAVLRQNSSMHATARHDRGRQEASAAAGGQASEPTCGIPVHTMCDDGKSHGKRSALVRSPGVLMMSNTAQAAWQTRGLPANVLPWSPGAITAATCSLSSTAPMGRPPAVAWAQGSAEVGVCGRMQQPWQPPGQLQAPGAIVRGQSGRLGFKGYQKGQEDSAIPCVVSLCLRETDSEGCECRLMHPTAWSASSRP